ncbi:MAG TPA: cation-translocating P-type ATPase, partial [Spirochaetia bacterium]|nr:cation-translocating P-type ATPase [Spirochaetia bacterium]
MGLSEDEVKALTGLSDEEAQTRLSEQGFNELPSAKPRSVLRIMGEVAREPMFVLLVACGALYLTLGSIGEALMLLGFVFVVMGITIYQEQKTERALDALRDLSSPRALVIRQGRRLRIAGREVVDDDLVVLQEGDRVPADCELLWGMNVASDESFLTGESVPVRKLPASTGETGARNQLPGGDDLPLLFSGTLVTQGEGVARVVATGSQTELGKIGRALRSIQEEHTPLQKETGRIVKIVFFVAALLCLAVVLLYALLRTGWLDGILAGLTLAMAMLPEEFPVVLTIFLALGAYRLSKSKVLTRRIAAVETLGSATVLCTDKTGTLTENRMSIDTLDVAGQVFFPGENKGSSVPERFHPLIEYGILASKRDPFDPMEKALMELGRRRLAHTEHLHPGLPLIEAYPLSRELLALSHVWPNDTNDGYRVSAKGAPEAVADLCHLSAGAHEDIAKRVDAMAARGLRVLGVAKAMAFVRELPRSQHDFDFEFIGLVGLADPVRASVPHAIAECERAGIRVIMITGDYPATAKNIAASIGLDGSAEVITGSELDAMDPAELQARIRTAKIFARVVPEQKLSIVSALKANGDIVAMTGDGVNDAPALKAAHIGVAMGERGTDVAREASAIVLLEDDFSSIVAAVRIGRRIYDNLKKAMSYVIAVHLPIAGMSLLPVLVGWPMVLTPVHIVFLELIIDPACSIVFEQEVEEGDVMSRPPRRPGEPLFSLKTLTSSVGQGLTALAAVAGIYAIARGLGYSGPSARAVGYIALIIANLGLILSNRSWSLPFVKSMRRPNAALRWVLGGAVAFLALVLSVPFLRDLFHFGLL